MEGESFSWIHVSDVHLGHGDAGYASNQAMVLETLKQDIAQQLRQGTPAPDALFVTGDIAFSGAVRDPDEYKRAARWLQLIVDVARIDSTKVFVVPGNHDVQRSADSAPSDAERLRAWRNGSSFDAALGDEAGLSYLKRRQANYLSFARAWGPDSARSGSEARLYWQHLVNSPRGGFKIRVLALNTALLAADEATFGDDKGQLRLTERQIHDTLFAPSSSEEEVVIVLSHHPLSGQWLADESTAVAWLSPRADIHLCGHVHQADPSQLVRGARKGLITIVGGATHEERNPSGLTAKHGYSFGSLRREGNGVSLRCWPRVWSSRNTVFVPDVDTLGNNETSAEFVLPRIRLSTGAPAPENPSGHVPVSTIDRGVLLVQLQSLLPSMFSEVVFRLRVPVAHLPSEYAPLTQRALSLIQWAESAPGVGLGVLQQIVAQISKQR